jgi:hypothetical protein
LVRNAWMLLSCADILVQLPYPKTNFSLRQTTVADRQGPTVYDLCIRYLSFLRPLWTTRSFPSFSTRRRSPALRSWLSGRGEEAVIVERGERFNCRGEDWRGLNCRGEEWRGLNCRGEEWRGLNCRGEEWRGLNCRG